MSHFFDSYAIIELINKNPAYEKFAESIITTNVLNLGEVYYYLLKIHNKQTADYWMRVLSVQLLDVSAEIAIEAASFRFEHRKKAFSYPDCIGYLTALSHKLQFVTGDREFKGMPDVVFVK